MIETKMEILFGALTLRNQRSLTFSTDQTERLRIDPSGNVGIGTDSPTAALDIQGVSGANPGDNLHLQFTGSVPCLLSGHQIPAPD